MTTFNTLNLTLKPAFPASFTSRNKVTKTLNKKVKVKDFNEWKRTQDAYTLHAPIRYKFKRRKTYASKINDLWQIDLIDVSNIKKFNNDHKFILTSIDVLSKQAQAIALKNKSGLQVKEAIKKLLKHKAPDKIQNDKGKEFYNKHVKELLQERNILTYSTENDDIKAAIVERFNRTLKNKMYKYFTKYNTLHYLDVLPKLIESYNHTYHRSIGMAPVEANEENEAEIWSRLYRKDALRRAKPKFKIGDKVRISKAKQPFRRGYLQNWSEEIFTICKMLPTNPSTYRLQDYYGEELQGIFYEPELVQVVKDDDMYIVEKVLKKKKLNGKTKYLVKWKGYPEKFNSYVDEENIKDLVMD